MALGAAAADTFRLVVGEAARVILGGVALGLLGAALLGRAFVSLLFGVPPIDALTFVAAAAALTVVGVLAACVPAARAAQIDPVIALRE
jgi:ABC-type antimicrobial peptide transport system permease subunit